MKVFYLQKVNHIKLKKINKNLQQKNYKKKCVMLKI